MREDRLLRFWQSDKFKIFYGTLKFLLAQGQMGLKFLKRYSCYIFYPILAKFYEK